MDFYDLLKQDLPFALSLQYNLIYAFSYPDSESALEAINNVPVCINLLRSGQQLIESKFDLFKLEQYLRSTMILETNKLNQPTFEQLADLDETQHKPFIEKRKKANAKLGIQKYKNVRLCFEQLSKYLEQIDEKEARHVYQLLKIRESKVECTRVQSLRLRDVFENRLKIPLPSFHKKAPHLKEIEYEELIAMNDPRYPKIQQTASFTNLNPFGTANNQTENNSVQSDLPPAQRSLAALEFIRKSDLEEAAIRKYEKRYTGLNIEVMLEVMCQCLRSSIMLIKCMGKKQLRESNLMQMKNARTRIELIIHRYIRKLNTQIKHIIQKAWGYMDSATRISDFIDIYDYEFELLELHKKLEMQSGLADGDESDREGAKKEAKQESSKLPETAISGQLQMQGSQITITNSISNSPQKSTQYTGQDCPSYLCRGGNYKRRVGPMSEQLSQNQLWMDGTSDLQIRTTVHHRMGNVKQLRDELSPRAVLPIVVPGSHLNQNAVIKTPKASRYMNTDRFPEKKSYSSFLSKMDSLMTKDKREIWRVSDEEEHPEGDIEAPRRGNSGYWKTRQF